MATLVPAPGRDLAHERHLSPDRLGRRYGARLDAATRYLLRSARDSEENTVQLDSLRIMSQTNPDLVVTDPLNTYFRVDSLIRFTSAEAVQPHPVHEYQRRQRIPAYLRRGLVRARAVRQCRERRLRQLVADAASAEAAIRDLRPAQPPDALHAGLRLRLQRLVPALSNKEPVSCNRQFGMEKPLRAQGLLGFGRAEAVRRRSSGPFRMTTQPAVAGFFSRALRDRTRCFGIGEVSPPVP